MDFATKYRAIIAVAVLAIVLRILFIPDRAITGTSLPIGSGGYDIETVSAPTLYGGILDSFSRDLSSSRFGPWMRRYLLNNNNIEIIRELASQVALPPLYYPMVRVPDNEWDLAMKSSKHHDLSRARVLKRGLARPRVDMAYASIEDYAAAYRAGNITPTAVMKVAIAKVRELERSGFYIFSSINETDVMEQARMSEARYAAGAQISVLDGVPIAFKDMLGVKGHAIYNGKNPEKDWDKVYRHEDPVVDRFRETGAVVFGVTIMTEGGTTPLGYNVYFKGPLNPYSSGHYSGGSSSGSAVAVAVGIVPLAVGFDGGGSIRIPAALSGVYGLACTFGRIPNSGPIGSTMIKGGPLSATASDAAIGYMVMAGATINKDDFYTKLYDGGVRGPPPPHLADFDSKDLKGMRIGIFSDWFVDADKKVVDLCTGMLMHLRGMGVELVEVKIPHLRWLAMSHGIKISTEFAMEWDLFHHTRLEDMEPNTRVSIAIGSSVSALEVIAADRLRAWALNYTKSLFATHGISAIINPTVGFTAPVLHDSYKLYGISDSGLVMKMMKHIFLANFLGMPSISIPAGFSACPATKKPLPVGIQLTAPHWQESVLLRIANILERTTKIERMEPIHFVNPVVEASSKSHLRSG